MPVIERSIQVTWRHQIHFTEDVFERSNPVLAQVLRQEGATLGRKAKTLVVLDEAMTAATPGLVQRILDYFCDLAPMAVLVCPPVVMLGGEAVKNAYFRVSEIHALIDRHHIDRQGYIIAVGGGALLDMVGLAAATAHRGVRHIRIPTTTLAQDDSGVGVKNGINAFGKKNFVGTFAPPYAVINDFKFLATLTPRDKRAGYVEAVKVACIRDASFFAEIERSAEALSAFEPEAMKRLIQRCAEHHVEHIATAGDPFEMGSARPLDFGHWAAHKLEQLSEFRLRHGEAVAIGIALDVIYSRLDGLLQRDAANRVLRLLERLGFELFTQELLHEDEHGRALVLGGLEEFREHLGGELTLTLIEDIGRRIEVHEMRIPLVLEAIRELETRSVASAAA